MPNSQAYPKDAYSVPEVSQITGFPRSTLYDGVNRGEVPSIRVGAAIRIPGYWLRRQLTPAQPAAAAAE